MEQIFRITDFNVYNEKQSDEDSEEVYKDSSTFSIQIFGLDEKGKTFSVIVENFKPFFYVMVNDTWNLTTKDRFIQSIKQKIGKYYEDCITNCIIVKRKKLYGFDGGKEHKFIKIEFENMGAFNKTKNLWYTSYTPTGRKLLKNGYIFAMNKI